MTPDKFESLTREEQFSYMERMMSEATECENRRFMDEVLTLLFQDR